VKLIMPLARAFDGMSATAKHFGALHLLVAPGFFLPSAPPAIILANNMALNNTTHPESERFERGWKKLKEVDGEAGHNVIESLKDISPDLGRYTIEFPFGDVYSRGILSLKEREISTISALAALGNALPQLKVHIHGALNVGCTRQEIIEIFIQMAVYAGFPAALNATFAAKEVFQERDKKGLKDKS
jgi:4-carboxymuconolactone decarboxylase